MAIEGQEQVVDQNVGASSTTDATKTNDTTTGEQKPAGASGTQPDKSGEYEKRITGMTADLQKERRARQQYESDLKAARAEIEAGNKRVRALAGVETKSTQETEDESIKARLEALGYPSLSREDLDAIREL